MNRVDVPFDRYFSPLCQALQDYGALLVSLDQKGRPNPMTIGWAQLGVIWGRHICTVLVRPSRYTYDCCNHTGDFTVNVPYPSQADEATLCGTRSGRDLDKMSECGFTAMPARCGDLASPYLAQCGLAVECKVVHHNDLPGGFLATSVVEGCYPQGDLHRVYFGEILAVHADEDFEARFAAGG